MMKWDVDKALGQLEDLLGGRAPGTGLNRVYVDVHGHDPLGAEVEQLAGVPAVARAEVSDDAAPHEPPENLLLGRRQAAVHQGSSMMPRRGIQAVVASLRVPEQLARSCSSLLDSAQPCAKALVRSR